MPLRCSIVIPTYGRVRLLTTCLKALSHQSVPTDSFEIIVVDDGNDEVVAKAVARFERKSGIRTQYMGQIVRRGPAAARNRGWQAAHAQLIAFTDDDCIPEPDWLQTALSAFDKGAYVLTGRVQIPLPDQPMHHDRTTALVKTAEFITANCFCRRSALKAVGGFEEAFDIAWREDSDLQFKLLEGGYQIDTCPEAVVQHPVRPAPWYAPLRDERKNRYDALLFKRHPNLFRQRIPAYRGLVLRYYGIVISVVVGLLALVQQNEPLLATAGSSWLVLTGSLMVERWPTKLSLAGLRKIILTTLLTPFLSIYWRLYGAVKYWVLYL